MGRNVDVDDLLGLTKEEIEELKKDFERDSPLEEFQKEMKEQYKLSYQKNLINDGLRMIAKAVALNKGYDLKTDYELYAERNKEYGLK